MYHFVLILFGGFWSIFLCALLSAVCFVQDFHAGIIPEVGVICLRMRHLAWKSPAFLFAFCSIIVFDLFRS